MDSDDEMNYEVFHFMVSRFSNDSYPLSTSIDDPNLNHCLQNIFLFGSQACKYSSTKKTNRFDCESEVENDDPTHESSEAQFAYGTSCLAHGVTNAGHGTSRVT